MDRRAPVISRAAALISAHLTLSEQELRSIEPYLRPFEAPEGASLWKAGEVCRHLLLLSRGLVRVFYVHKSHEVNLRLLCAPSAVIALGSYLRGQPSDETVQALSTVEGVMVRFADFVNEHRGETAERLQRVLAEQHYLAMERRLRNLQWRTARERWDYFVAHMEPEIVASVPGYHVASYLGVRPESLSRVRSAALRSGKKFARS